MTDDEQAQKMRRTIVALQSRIDDLENQQRDAVSLRDRIAIAAMNGELAGQRDEGEYDSGSNWSDRLAKRAYEIADAMLAAREKSVA